MVDMKVSYSIWLKRCEWKNETLENDKRHNPNVEVDILEDFKNGKQDERTQEPQES
jgi:hypothetical protein